MQESQARYNSREAQGQHLSSGDTIFADGPAGDEPIDPARAPAGPASAGSDAESTPIGTDLLPSRLNRHAIIAGYGLPGRAVAEALEAANIPFCVIERNTDVVSRCSRGGVTIIEGNAASEATLLEAGIDRAQLFAITVPSDASVLEAVTTARRMNSSIRILARCEYLSTGLKATRRGADEVVVAEQAVATEFGRLIRSTTAMPERQETPGFSKG